MVYVNLQVCKTHDDVLSINAGITNILEYVQSCFDKAKIDYKELIQY